MRALNTSARGDNKFVQCVVSAPGRTVDGQVGHNVDRLLRRHRRSSYSAEFRLFFELVVSADSGPDRSAIIVLIGPKVLRQGRDHDGMGRYCVSQIAAPLEGLPGFDDGRALGVWGRRRERQP